ncbi:unnamed protein product [Nesidiocoris tenuis]|uniref:Uncharacterized protein n=1 Tax=Nesidiocoris tenuis TaxID=355587 RepID=A0A6H5GUT1_9HEMI|nr:unnamed protein product [Nesidiocoris tenuis]
MRFLLPQLPMAFDKLFCQALLDSQHISSLQPSRVQAGFLSPDSQTRDRMAATLAQSISVWSDSKAVRADVSAGSYQQCRVVQFSHDSSRGLYSRVRSRTAIIEIRAFPTSTFHSRIVPYLSVQFPAGHAAPWRTKGFGTRAEGERPISPGTDPTPRNLPHSRRPPWHHHCSTDRNLAPLRKSASPLHACTPRAQRQIDPLIPFSDARPRIMPNEQLFQHWGTFSRPTPRPLWTTLNRLLEEKKVPKLKPSWSDTRLPALRLMSGPVPELSLLRDVIQALSALLCLSRLI